MRIAFDLDDTLIPGRTPFKTEPPPRGLLRGIFPSNPYVLERSGFSCTFASLAMRPGSTPHRSAGHWQSDSRSGPTVCPCGAW